MMGNSVSGYRLRIDDAFVADILLSMSRNGEVTQTNWYVKTAGVIVGGGYYTGCHEQAAANAAGRWFADRARKWSGK